MRYELYRDRQGKWRWRLRAANGRIRSVSSEGYTRKIDCLDCLNETKASANVPIKELK